jgi:hypothetical protein
LRTKDDFKDWVGLAYWQGCPYMVDHFSSPDGWNYGFEIVYRLVFNGFNKMGLDECRRVVKTAFGLSDSHFDLSQTPESLTSVFWHIYWDREGFDLNILKRCEMELDRVAEEKNLAITIIGMFIIPRSIEHITMLAKDKPFAPAA